MINKKGVFLLYSCAALLLLFALDRIFFGWMIFSIKNPSGWDSFRWYNFEYQFRSLEKEKDDRPLVLVVGSSISQYSVQKDILEKDLYAKSKIRYRVEMLTHASMLPSDLAHYSARIDSLHPAAVLYLMNPGDIDLERYTRPWEVGPVYSNRAHVKFLNWRYSVRVFYPASYVFENLLNMDVETSAKYLFAGLLDSVRFRNEWLDPLMFDLYYRPYTVKPLRGYLYYQGEPNFEGLYRDGHTGACFSIPASEKKIFAEIPEVLAFAGMRMDVYKRSKNKSDMEKERFAGGKEILSEYMGACRIPPRYQKIISHANLQSGWQNISLPEISSDSEYFIHLSHVEDESGHAVKSGIDSFSGKGIRLPGNYMRNDLPSKNYYVRQRSLEEIRLYSLSDREYIEDFARRIAPEDWRSNPVVSQLNRLRLAKYMTNWYPFEKTRQIEEIEKFLKKTDHSVRIVVNNPENPVTLASYGRSEWYSGYLKAMSQMKVSFKKAEFIDLKDSLRMQYFIDDHHLTYEGMLVVSPVYADLILAALNQPSSGSREGICKECNGKDFSEVSGVLR